MWRLLSQRWNLLTNRQWHQTLSVPHSVHRTPVWAGQMSVLRNGQVFDVILEWGFLQVSTRWNVDSVRRISTHHQLMIWLIFYLCVCLCVAVPTVRPNPAALPVWTTAQTDNVRWTLAHCCLSASKIWHPPPTHHTLINTLFLSFKLTHTHRFHVSSRSLIEPTFCIYTVFRSAQLQTLNALDPFVQAAACFFVKYLHRCLLILSL